MVKGH